MDSGAALLAAYLDTAGHEKPQPYEYLRVPPLAISQHMEHQRSQSGSGCSVFRLFRDCTQTPQALSSPMDEKPCWSQYKAMALPALPMSPEQDLVIAQVHYI